MDTTNPDQTVELPSNGEKRREEEENEMIIFADLRGAKTSREGDFLLLLIIIPSIERRVHVHTHTHTHTHLCSRRECKVDQILFTFTFRPPAACCSLPLMSLAYCVVNGLLSFVIHHQGLSLYAYLSDEKREEGGKKNLISPTLGWFVTENRFLHSAFSLRWFSVGQHSSR